LVATAICGGASGVLDRLRPSANHFRITLHRVLSIHREELLQQACDYSGRLPKASISTAGRTFPAQNATIGLAYRTRQIIRSARNVSRQRLLEGMAALNLNDASRKMNTDVGFVLAIPILQPLEAFVEPSPVSGIIYVDSTDNGFWLSDDELGELTRLITHMVSSIYDASSLPLDRLRNLALRDQSDKASVPSSIPDFVSDALEEVPVIAPPTIPGAFSLNFDHSDLTPLMIHKGRTEELSPFGAP
jgi:hypothetical protein